MPGGWLPIRTGAGIGKCNRPHLFPESAAGRSVSVQFRPMSGCLNTPGRGGSCSGGRQGRRRPVIMSARSRMSPERSTSIRYSSRLIFCRASVNRGGPCFVRLAWGVFLLPAAQKMIIVGQRPETVPLHALKFLFLGFPPQAWTDGRLPCFRYRGAGKQSQSRPRWLRSRSSKSGGQPSCLGFCRCGTGRHTSRSGLL